MTSDNQAVPDGEAQSSLPNRAMIGVVVIFPIALCVIGFVLVGKLL